MTLRFYLISSLCIFILFLQSRLCVYLSSLPTSVLPGLSQSCLFLRISCYILFVCLFCILTSPCSLSRLFLAVCSPPAVSSLSSTHMQIYCLSLLFPSSVFPVIPGHVLLVFSWYLHSLIFLDISAINARLEFDFVLLCPLGYAK